MRTVACDSRVAFIDNCDAGREVTLNAGGGDLSRIVVGTMGVGSVRSKAAAALGEERERRLALGCGLVGGGRDGEEDEVVTFSSESSGAV